MLYPEVDLKDEDGNWKTIEFDQEGSVRVYCEKDPEKNWIGEEKRNEIKKEKTQRGNLKNEDGSWKKITFNSNPVQRLSAFKKTDDSKKNVQEGNLRNSKSPTFNVFKCRRD